MPAGTNCFYASPMSRFNFSESSLVWDRTLNTNGMSFGTRRMRGNFA